MTGFLIQLALSNLLVSAILAGAAYAVHRRGAYPVLAHLLWVLVLVKLITPPLLTLPVAALRGTDVLVTGQGLGSTATAASSLDTIVGSAAQHGVTALLVAWALGTGVILVVSLWRIHRFDRLLRATSREAPAEIQLLAAGLARPLGLGSAPTIYVSAARLSPLTWWTGGRVRIVIPAVLPHEVGTERLGWVLAHELAHVKRRDYLVRWLEWLACATFWWNPIAWWARRNLHHDEEASCDALVLERLGVEPRSYASTLLAVVEFLSGQTTRPPAVATGIDAQGSLERRLTLIMARDRIKRAPRWLVVGAMSTALIMIPFGFGSGAVQVPPGPTSVGTPDARPTDDEPAGAVADEDDFQLLSASLSGGTVTAMSFDRDSRAAKRARRAVGKAIHAGLDAGPTGDAGSKRGTRKAISRAKAKLDRTVTRGVVSQESADSLVKGMRKLIKSGQTKAHEVELDEAISAAVISPKNADRLLKGLEKAIDKRQ